MKKNEKPVSTSNSYCVDKRLWTNRQGLDLSMCEGIEK